MLGVELKSLSDLNKLPPLTVSEIVSGLGSFITIKLHSEPRQSETIDIWIYLCSWKLISEDVLVASSNSSKSDIERAVSQFRGRQLERVKELRRGRVDIVFFGGGKLMLQNDEKMYASNDDLFKVYLGVERVYCYSTALGLYAGSN